MAFPLINPKPTFLDSNGVPLVSGTVEFRDPTTDAAVSSYPTYDDAEALTNANPDVITLNARGEAPDGMFFPDNTSVKMEVKNNGVSQYVVDDVLSPGASSAAAVTLADAGGNYAAANVEAAFTELASTVSGEGASIIGVEDSASNFTATDVEGVLAELRTTSVTEAVKFKTANESKATDTALADDTHLNGWALIADKHYLIEGYLMYIQTVGNLNWKWQFSDTPQLYGTTMSVTDLAKTNVITTSATHDATLGEQGMGDGQRTHIVIHGHFNTNASTGGTLDFQWAQQTSSANNTTLYEGSWIRVRQID